MVSMEEKKENFLSNPLDFIYSENFLKKYINSSALLDKEKEKLSVGDLIEITYKVPENGKETIHTYQGLIISIKNRGIQKSFTIRRAVQGIGVEQTFIAHSPNIISLKKQQSFRVRRSKLYFLRNLRGKSLGLKRKRF